MELCHKVGGISIPKKWKPSDYRLQTFIKTSENQTLPVAISRQDSKLVPYLGEDRCQKSP
jgi:hypothetical protein